MWIQKKFIVQIGVILYQSTIIKYMENNSTCFLISLDAEKAFDKLWIVYKLIKRLSNQDWLVLKEYYDK
jgi:hypothetical protein